MSPKRKRNESWFLSLRRRNDWRLARLMKSITYTTGPKTSRQRKGKHAEFSYFSMWTIQIVILYVYVVPYFDRLVVMNAWYTIINRDNYSRYCNPSITKQCNFSLGPSYQVTFKKTDTFLQVFQFFFFSKTTDLFFILILKKS